ncbi:MAG: hypothetical protein KDI15_07510 [Thiothrix sp.]|nr:hypothetical protein [Thiothrix sp.]HPE59417.1 hypothetical protein [Thiolinea sp.]
MVLAQVDTSAVSALLGRFGLRLRVLPPDSLIPGSYWGAPEAGLIGTTVYVRPDTPLHSLLHESCHVICMDEARRARLHTDAGGETPEEDAVCYLQILLADRIPGFGRARALNDMDAWGYTFRLGSAQRWFEEDAEAACQWLIRYQLIDSDSCPCYRLRQY